MDINAMAFSVTLGVIYEGTTIKENDGERRRKKNK
jgi:hypothetical protein